MSSFNTFLNDFRQLGSDLGPVLRDFVSVHSIHYCTWCNWQRFSYTRKCPFLEDGSVKMSFISFFFKTRVIAVIKMVDGHYQIEMEIFGVYLKRTGISKAHGLDAVPRNTFLGLQALFGCSPWKLFIWPSPPSARLSCWAVSLLKGQPTW